MLPIIHIISLHHSMTWYTILNACWNGILLKGPHYFNTWRVIHPIEREFDLTSVTVLWKSKDWNGTLWRCWVGVWSCLLICTANGSDKMLSNVNTGILEAGSSRWCVPVCWSTFSSFAEKRCNQQRAHIHHRTTWILLVCLPLDDTISTR